MSQMNKALQKEQIGKMLENQGIARDTVDIEAEIDEENHLDENIKELEKKLDINLYAEDLLAMVDIGESKEESGNRKMAQEEIKNLVKKEGYEWTDIVDFVESEKNQVVKDIKETYSDSFVYATLIGQRYCSKREVASRVYGLKEEIKKLVRGNSDYQELLEDIIRYEEVNDIDQEEGIEAGWKTTNIGANPGYIAQLLSKGIIRKVYDSNQYTMYQLVNREDTKEALEEAEQVEEEEEEKHSELEIEHKEREAEDDDIQEFKEILKENDGLNYWYPYVNPKLQNMEEQKKAVLLSLASMNDKYGNRNRIHVLLSGEPGTGKSKLGSWISKKLGHLRSSNRSTQVGLTGDLRGEEVTPGDLVNAHKKHLIIDELDEFKKKDRAGLLESMSDGTVTLSGGGKKKEFKAESTVIALTNRTENFREELIDRYDFFIECESPEGESGKEIVGGIIDDWNREKGDYEGKKLEKFLNWVKEFEPEIPDKERKEIKQIVNKYIDKRDSDKVKIRKYEKILRIAIAIARLNHRNVQKNDALRAINLTDGDLMFSNELM